MSFEKREITRYSATMGHVTFPAELIGKTVYVVTDTDVNDLAELIEKTLILRKVDRMEQKEFKDRLDSFQRDHAERLTRIENVVYGIKQESIPKLPLK